MQPSWSSKPTTKSPGSAGTSPATPHPAMLYEVGFNHFFHGKTDGNPGDAVYIQGHAAPGVYARAFLERRLDEGNLDRFRQEIGGGGLSSYPHPTPHARLLGIPNGVHGPRSDQQHLPGTLQQVPAESANRRNRDQPRLVLHRRRRGRRAGNPRFYLAWRPRTPRQSDLGDQLQPPATRRSRPGQREDHSGARGDLPGRRVERHQSDLGLQVG